MKRGGPRLIPLAGVLSLAAGCGTAAPAPAAFTVRDSAGIQVVESVSPTWAPEEAWRVAPEPALHIGVVEGDSSYQFSIIAGLWRTADGRIVVADARAVQVRTYDPGGTFLSSFGRRGNGPGEFPRLSFVRPFRGDSIIATADGTRITVFDEDGRLGRTFTLESRAPEPQGTGSMTLIGSSGLTDVFSDGTLVAEPGVAFRADPGQRISVSSRLSRYSPEGVQLGELYETTVETTFPNPTGGPVPPRPYSRQFIRGLVEDRLYVGRSATFELELLRVDGSTERVIRVPGHDLTLGSEAREAYLQSQRQSAQGRAQPEAMEAALRDIEFPATIPPYSQALVDSENHLWVRHYPLPGRDGPRTWSVFAPEGHLLGTLQTPERLDVRQIGRNFLLGIWTDELDVRHVRSYALDRRGAG